MKILLPLLALAFLLPAFAQDAKVTYVDGDGYKTFHHVFGDDGKGLITKGAGGQYTHHRGLFLGWAKTSTAGGAKGDWWHCKGVSVRHKEYKDGGATVVNDWCNGEGTPVVRDTRAVKTSVLKDGTRQMDFDITVESLDGDLNLNGDPQHAGFQFRAHNGVTKSHAKYVRPATAENKGNDVWINSPWMVGTFDHDGTAYTVQHMQHPENPKFAETVYSTRNYGRFGAYAPHKVKEGEKLNLKYRILIGNKAPTQDKAQARFEAWTK